MKYAFWLVPVASLLLVGCGGSVKRTLGMERTVPDEFAVVERAPLVMPPDFDLVPPRPGAPRPQETAQTEALVLGQGSKAQSDNIQASAGENALLSQIGTRSDPNIRQELRGADDLAEPSTVSERLGLTTPKRGKALDPVEEAEKLQQKNVKTSGSISAPNKADTADKETGKK